MSGRSAIELLLALDRAAAGPLRAQLEAQLRAAVRAACSRPARALPSTRALARELGVSRGVVVEAYDAARRRGLPRARARAPPTRVADAALPAARRRPGAAPRERAPRFDFRPGAPDVALFPRARWLASLAPGAARRARRPPRLRRPARRARAARGARRLPRARARRRVRPGARGRSRPAWPRGSRCSGARWPARGARRDRRRGPVERAGPHQLAATGLRAGAGRRSTPTALRRRRARRRRRPMRWWSTPAHQFPTGVVLAPERRAALVEWAAARDALVLEDDYDAEYRYDRDPVGARAGPRARPRGLRRARSSKTLAPALRLGLARRAGAA